MGRALFFVYAAQFLRLCFEVIGLSSPPLNRAEHLLIHRIQSHTNPKRRKGFLKQAGQKSVKEELPKQRKGPKRTKECRLKVPTHIWEDTPGQSHNFISGCCAVGSAPALGAGGPGFESPHSDQILQKNRLFRRFFCVLSFAFCGFGGCRFAVIQEEGKRWAHEYG